MQGRWDKVKAVFGKAAELPSADRGKFLEKACAGDETLRHEVEQLLKEVSASDTAAIFNDPPPQSLSSGEVVANRFHLEGMVGRGGMGEVYQATDQELGGTVALKVLAPELTANADFFARFRREVQVARQVTHPNLCRIFDVGYHDRPSGRLVFFTMEFLAGQSLATRLRRDKRIGDDEVSSIATQLSAGLGALHDQGIIHRDLKPGNVMLVPKSSARAESGNAFPRVVICDFGLARGQVDSGTADSETHSSLTRTGQILGTPDYMAPEQLTGGEIGPASDIYAFGLVLYEALTGKKPFAGKRGPIENAVQRLTEDPTPPDQVAPWVRPVWNDVILRCLAKDPARRPSAADLEASLREGRALPSPSHPDMAASAGAGSATRTILSPQPDLHPESGARSGSSDAPPNQTGAPASGQIQLPPPGITRRSLGWIAAAAAGATAAGGYAYWKNRRDNAALASKGTSLAVLPFVDLSRDNDYLSDGLADELISTLSKVRSLRVVARTSAFQFRDAKADTREIARQLNVNRILMGSLRRAGNQIRLSVQLVNAEDSTVLWGETFARPAADVFTVPGQIASAVMNKLAVRPDQAGLATRGSTTNAEAYNNYLQGLYQWNLRSPAAFELALANFRRALELDPKYPLAWTGVADTQVLRSLFGLVSPLAAMREAKQSAERALALEPDQAEAHNSMGLILLLYDWKRAAAEVSLKRALELNQGYATGHHWYGHYLIWSARFQKGFAELAIAQDLDPLSLAIRTNIGWLSGLNRRFDEGIGILRSVLGMDSRFVRAHLYLAMQLGQIGRFDEAHSELKLVRDLTGDGAVATGVEAWLFARAKATTRAAEAKGKLLAFSAKSYVSPVEMMIVCSAMGQRQEARQWLQRAIDDRAPTLAWAKVDFRLDESMGDSEFMRMLEQVG